MKAAVIRRPGSRKVLAYEDAEVPDVPAGHGLVRVETAGVCGSDLHGFLDADGTARDDGLIMGHEAAGVVEETAADVTTVRPGDRVTIDPQVTCGQCAECRQGLISICANKRVLGSSLRGFVQGAMAEYVVVAAHRLHRLPADVSPAAGALVEPLSNAVHVAKRARIGLGDTVVVLGSGTLGLLITQCVKLVGAETVLVTDTDARRLELAQKLGADVTVDVTHDSFEAAVDKHTAGRGADVVVEAVGISATYQQAVRSARRRATVVFFGAVSSYAELPLYPILHKELDLVGSTGGNDDDTSSAITLVRDGRVDVTSLVTSTYPLSRAGEALDEMAAPGSTSIKTQLVP